MCVCVRERERGVCVGGGGWGGPDRSLHLIRSTPLPGHDAACSSCCVCQHTMELINARIT